MHWHSAANEAIKLHDSRTYPLITVYPQPDTSRYIKQVASEANHIPSFLECTLAQQSVVMVDWTKVAIASGLVWEGSLE